MRRFKSLYDVYALPGFRTLRRLKGLFGVRLARVVVLKRRGIRRAAGPAGLSVGPTTTAAGDESATCPVVPTVSTWNWNCVVSGAATASP